MQGKGRRTFLNFISIMGILAMVMLWPTTSQAQYARPQPRPAPKPSPPPTRSVPEPMTNLSPCCYSASALPASPAIACSAASKENKNPFYDTVSPHHPTHMPAGGLVIA